ncbi:MAG: hypothetical protein ACK50J_00790, partial [Planctomyces sp.]
MTHLMHSHQPRQRPHSLVIAGRQSASITHGTTTDPDDEDSRRDAMMKLFLMKFGMTQSEAGCVPLLQDTKQYPGQNQRPQNIDQLSAKECKCGTTTTKTKEVTESGFHSETHKCRSE